MKPVVIDISHHNTGPLKGGAIDFAAAKAAGILGVICKASEGAGYGDPTYAARRVAIKAAGLLHGAYHFNTGEAVKAQVDRFFDEAEPDDQTLMVLDFEQQNVKSKGDMSILQLVEFLRLVEARLGRKAAIYSGNRLKETIGRLGPADKSYVCGHRLWLAQYGSRAVLPAGFSKYWLWQYTGDGFGLPPHSIAGVKGNGIDLNTFDGTPDELAATWSGSGSAPSSDIRDGVINVNALNIRAKPDATSAIVGTLDPYTPVKIYGEVMNGPTKWFKIDGGYVAARYVDADE